MPMGRLWTGTRSFTPKIPATELAKKAKYLKRYFAVLSKEDRADIIKSFKDDEMVLTVHCWFKNKSCPGTWLLNRMDILAETVTYLLEEKHSIYRVQVGAYTIKSNAEEMEKKLKDMGIDCFIVEVEQ